MLTAAIWTHISVIQEITNTRMRGKIGAEFWKFIAHEKGDQALVFELKESADSENLISRKVYKISVQ